MIVESRLHLLRKTLLSASATVALILAALVGIFATTPGAAHASGVSLPCDIFAANGTPCVAAHSTARALFGGYGGRLYQVTRVSDGRTTDIGTLFTGGYADAGAQDAFCEGTTCYISIIYDQTSNGNNLNISPGGGANSQADIGALASQLQATAGGYRVYGAYVAPGVGYRDLSARGTAQNGQAEGMYMVTSGTHVNNGCCFDYGNTEQPLANDTGNGHMDSVYFGLRCEHPPCSGPGPWIAGDLENGLFQGNGSNTGDQTVNSNFVTAMLANNGQNTFNLSTGNANSGGLTTQYNGTLPTGGFSGYTPMHQEGGIVMGVGGDNSNGSDGSFYEGAMTSGYPSSSAQQAIQANIVGVGYSGDTRGILGSTITGYSGKCVDVSGDDTGGAGTPVQLWDCQSGAVDQHWVHNSDNSLSTLGRCLDIIGDGTAAGTKVELWQCNNVGGQKWVQQANGSLLNPQSGLCLDDPNGNTTNGTVLQIYTCNGNQAQAFPLGGAITGYSGKCVDVAGDDTGGNTTPVQLWDCQSYAIDQHWVHNVDNSLGTLGRCLDIDGNGTALGTKVELYQCNNVGGQKWVQQGNGSLLNPQSGLCLDDPSGNTTNGTVLQIYTCNGSQAQAFTLH